MYLFFTTLVRITFSVPYMKSLARSTVPVVALALLLCGATSAVKPPRYERVPLTDEEMEKKLTEQVIHKLPRVAAVLLLPTSSTFRRSRCRKSALRATGSHTDRRLLTSLTARRSLWLPSKR